ncbi:IclR family transcriptional regulator [Saccharopolyspora sp. NPDC000995]
MAERKTRSRIQSVDRAAHLLEVLASVDSRGAGLAEVATGLGVARSTAHAMLRTLEARGLVVEVAGPRFVLGTGLIRLGDIASHQLPIADVARPVLSALARETGMTTRLAIADNGYPVFVARVDGPGVVRFHTPLGGREAPHASAAGKIILSSLSQEQVRAFVEQEGLPRRTAKSITDLETLLGELDSVRARGFAVDDEEDLEGVSCIAAGVRDARGQIVGVISTTGIASELRTRSLPELGETVARFAAELSALIGR